MCPGSWTAHKQINKPQESFLYYRPKLHAPLFSGNPSKQPYMCIQFDNSPKNGSHVFFPLRPPRPKAHLRKQGQRDYDLRPCSRVLGMWWRCQRLTGNKKNLGKNRIFFSWDLNGSARETVLKCQFFTSFQLRDCQTKSRQYRRVWINQEGFELRLPWGDPRYLQLRSS